MENETFIYSFKVSNLERKQVAGAIANALIDATKVEEVRYAGAPSFGYHVGGWTIDRNGIVTSSEIESENLRTVLDALKNAGATAEGNGVVTFSMYGHTGISLRNIVNLISSKQGLIQKSLVWQKEIVSTRFVNDLNAAPINTIEDFGRVAKCGSGLDFDLADKTISFCFSNGSLDFDEVLAFITLCWHLNEQAMKQKFALSKQTEVVNDKYAFRVWLLKLGFIGEEYKAARKILLSKLDGNSSYLTPEAKQAAEEKRKGQCSNA